MKTLLLILIVSLSSTAFSQQWSQTSSTPDGAGITDMIVTDQGTLIVTTASWNTTPGFLGGIRRSTDHGQTWTNPRDGYNGRTLHKGENGMLFASYWPLPPFAEALYRSTNDGVTWVTVQGIPNGDNIFSIASKNSNNTIFIGTRNGVKRTTTGGSPFQFINSGIPANSWVRDIEVDTSTGIVVALTTNGVFSSTNNGDSWDPATGITPGDSIVKVIFDYPIALDGKSETTAYYGSDKGNIYTAVENSQYLNMVFLAIFKDSEMSGIFTSALSIPPDKKKLGAAMYPKTGTINENGGFIMTVDGQTFSTDNDGLPIPTKPSGLTGYLSGSGMALNYFLGSFENTSDGAKVFMRTYFVGINQISSEVPTEYRLNQNYPNPFNPSTKINFDIAKNDIVSLKVYNSIGKEVAVLVNEELPPGEYSFKFTANSISSGVYFYRLQSGDFSETKKMLLLK